MTLPEFYAFIMAMDIFCFRSGSSLKYTLPKDDRECNNQMVKACMADCLGLFDFQNFTKDCEFEPKTGEEIIQLENDGDCLDCPIISKNSESGKSIMASQKFVGPVRTVKTCGKEIFLSRANNFDFSLHSCALSNLKPWDPSTLEEIECMIQSLPSLHRSSGKLFANGVRTPCPKLPTITTNYTNCGVNKAKSFLLERWLPLAENVMEKELIVSSNSTVCAVISFSGATGTPAKNLRLEEIDCKKGSAFLCEANTKMRAKT